MDNKLIIIDHSKKIKEKILSKIETNISNEDDTKLSECILFDLFNKEIFLN